MSKTAVFFGPTGGSVHKVATMVAQAMGNQPVDLISVDHATPDALMACDHLILGVSTIGRANWDSSHTDSGWDAFLAQLKGIDLKGKRVAIFGLGDQMTYPYNFVDAIGWLHDRFQEMGATIDGYCSDNGYRYSESAAFRNHRFVGLPLDEDNEPDLTPARVSAWTNELRALGY